MIRKEFIVNELRYRYPEIAGGIRHPSYAVGRPILWEGSESNRGAHIVICSAQELNGHCGAAEDEPLYLCIGMPNQRAFDQLDLCVLPGDEQPAAVLNFVQRLFDRLDERSLLLKQTAESGAEMETLLSVAGEMLQNPIFLLDERRQIVSGFHSIDSAAQFDFFLQLTCAEDSRKDGVFHLSEEGKPELMISSIASGDTHYSLVAFATERSFYGSDEMLFESLAGYLRLTLSERKMYAQVRSRTRESAMAAEIIGSLLADDMQEDQAADALERIGWLRAGAYCVIVGAPEDGEMRAARVAAACRMMEAELPGSVAFVHAALLVALFRSQPFNDADFTKALSAISVETGFRFGVCESIIGFSCIPQRLEQAKYALLFADGNERVVCFSSRAEQFITAKVTEKLSPALVSMRSVSAMSQYDREHGTDYLETARAYVRNRFNAVKTASSLFIHRSTLLYRLERMKKQFGLDLDDECVSMLHLSLSLALIRETAREREA